MATLNQVISTIRFGLGQLSSLNKQHDFEHLCRHLARARICSNILPATGPVSSGGDQGRDFETFQTYLSSSPIANSSFLGLVSFKPIAFACTTTDIKDLVNKIKSDITTIFGSGEEVVCIHYFCTEDIPVAKRHELQEWVRTKYNQHLDIYDGQAISELLSGRDTFWIAENYLSIPAELYPPAPIDTEDDWYRETLNIWKNTNSVPDNYADYAQIKSALRHATYTESFKPDIPFWISIMQSLAENTFMPILKRKAIYEMIVASLRGLGTLDGYEEKLREYFNAIPSLSQLSEIEDANVLLTFCIRAYFQNVFKLSEAELSIWLKQIVEKIESELNLAQHSDRRCTLLRELAHRCIMPSLKKEGMPDVNGAIKYWLELTSLVDQTRLFPLDNFSDELSTLLSLPLNLNKYPDFHKVTQKIDEILENRYGGFIAAEKCRDRAFALSEKDEILGALNEIHTAKIKWFANETLRASVLSTLFASLCYQKLGLVFAAKYYALIASHIAVSSTDESVTELASQALAEVAFSDYLQGAFCGFFDFSDLSLRAYRAFSEERLFKQPISEIDKIIFYTTVIRIISHHATPECLSYVNDAINKWKGLEELFKEIIPLADKEWANETISDLWKKLESNLQGRPFSDVGNNRIFKFTALGVTWNFSWDNTYDLTIASEEFLSIFQIILADFASIDLCLLKANVTIEIEKNLVSDKILIENIPSNESIQYKIKIPINEKNADDANLFSILSTILSDVSLLPRKQFLNHLELALSKGLSGKVFFIQRYSTIYYDFINPSEYETSKRKDKSVPFSDLQFVPVLHHQLEWFSGPGLGYSLESSKNALENRYKKSIIPIRYTLKRLLQEASFTETVKSLKKEGWLDWHILTSIALATVNYRTNMQLHPSQGIDKYQKLFFEIMYREEDANIEAVPLSEFTKDKLKFHLFGSMSATLIGIKFEIHQRTPDYKAISDFLAKRYNYWVDDIEHPDFGF